MSGHFGGVGPYETLEENAQRLRAGDVGALATLGSLDRTDRKKDLYCLHPVLHHDGEKKDDGITTGITGTLCGNLSGRTVLRKEQRSNSRIITMRNEPRGGR
jgi:hypothetical protein